MASPYPVYKDIAAMLDADPELANQIDLDQLKPIIDLSYGAPSVLLSCDVLKRVAEIYAQRSKSKLKPKPKPKLGLKLKLKPAPELPTESESESESESKSRIKAVIRKKPADMKANIKRLNNNHHLALDMTQLQLEKLLKWSDQKYYLPQEDEAEPDLLTDNVYDYIKALYNKRRLLTNDRSVTMQSISSKTGVGARAETDKPRRERDTKLPLVLRSLGNLFIGTGDVDKWTQKNTGPYVISAKMDGTSALYHRGRLYTRGDAVLGRDISHTIQYLNLPEIPDNLAVRGEIVMSEHKFDTIFKGKKGATGLRKVNRNSVSGSLGTINNIDPTFLKELTFAAYEIINIDTAIQMAPSQAFKKLTEMGFHTAIHYTMDSPTDSTLSALYHNILDTYEFKIDGLVVQTDQTYRRETKKNPGYAKAFKEALDDDVAVTEVINIEWNPSQYGYLIPTVIYKPVEICGVTLERATAHNAREVIKLGLGPGAKIEVIYWGKVNPRVNKVLEAVDPDLPKVPYEWVPNDKEPVNIRTTDTDQSAIIIKKIHKFLVEIGAKGIGETTVEKIYNKGHVTIGDFINLKSSDISFLGPNASVKMVNSIKKAMSSITVSQLMAGSKVFGRGLGSKKFNKVIEQHPDFVVDRMSRSEYISLLMSVDGFAKKTAELAAEGMEAFWDFVDTEIPSDVYEDIIENTISKSDKIQGNEHGHSEINGKNICITGFRDKDITNFIESNGGRVQSGCNTQTHILIRKDSSYNNKKTDFAASNSSIRLMDKDEFMTEFLS